MTPDTCAAILINELDSMVHYIESLPAHPRYTDALMAVQAARQAMINGRLDLHQRGIKERASKTIDGGIILTKTNPEATSNMMFGANGGGGGGTGGQGYVMLDRRVPRNAPVQQPKMGYAYDAPWFIGYGYFKTYNVPEEFTSLFWTHHNNLSTEDFILRTHVESRGIPRVLQMCYTLDYSNDSWTLDIKRCPAELRKFYPAFPLKYTAKEWDEGGIRETWYKKLYYWVEDAGEYRLRHAAQAWHVEDVK